MSQQIGCSRFELFPDESRGSFDSGFTESGTKLTAFEHHAPGRIHFGKFHLFELKIGAHTDSKVYKIRNVNSSCRLPLNVFIFEQKYVGKGFAVMLVTKRWGGTAPRHGSEGSNSGNETNKWKSRPWFWNPRPISLKFQNRGIALLL